MPTLTVSADAAPAARNKPKAAQSPNARLLFIAIPPTMSARLYLAAQD
jgi:hypothetical protein